MERFFKLKERNTTSKTEFIAGIMPMIVTLCTFLGHCTSFRGNALADPLIFWGA